ncbi:hypothetical protein [Luteimonas vadosa]|uniref:Uncharacterized protein n=1 Tax=Luteimonas vadosa TaxID=1165507 RepID=A0ABP9DXS8_9GAMM
MTKVQPKTILAVTVVAAAAVALALVAPLVVAWKSDRDFKNSFVLADPTTQNLIVRAYLSQLDQQVTWCPENEGCSDFTTYFDRHAAQLLPISTPEPIDEYTILTARDDTLIDRSNLDIPLPLQQLLQRSVDDVTYNSDPQVPGVIYIPAPEDRPALREPKSCSSLPYARLVKMSRAAVSLTTNQAVSLVQTFYCDWEPGMHVVRFVHGASGWRVEHGGDGA